MEDLKIRLFRQDLINYINSVELPMEVKRLVLSEVLSQVTNETEKVLQYQLEESKKEEVNSDGIDENLQQDKLG